MGAMVLSHLAARDEPRVAPPRALDLAPPPGLALETDLPLEDTQTPDAVTLSEPSPRSTGTLKKIGAATALGLVGLGAAAGYTLSTAPVCDTGTISVSLDGVCVSPEASVGWNHVVRLAQGASHLDDLEDSLASHQNEVHHPDSPTTQPLSQDGLTAVTWNLHHGDAPDRHGARGQIDEMVQALKEQSADVYFLQEVSPWDVDDLVDGLGMEGYWAHTAPLQGNLILVHPELEVQDNVKRVVNYGDQTAIDVNGPKLILDVIDDGGLEPRVMQVLRVQEPDGDTAVLWNTHLMNGGDTVEERLAQADRSFDLVESLAAPGVTVLGGGDLNSGASSRVLADLRARGFDVDGTGVDWFATRNGAREEVQVHRLTDSQGRPLSDHPLVATRASGS